MGDPNGMGSFLRYDSSFFWVIFPAPCVQVVDPLFSKPVSVLSTEVEGLRMTVGTDETNVVRFVIPKVTVYMVDLEYEGLVLPFRWAATTFA